MHTIEIPEKNISAQYPSGWEELTTEQFAFVMQNWLKVVDGYLNQHEFKLIVLYHFLGIKYGPFDSRRDARVKPEKLEQKYENLWRLTETLEWLFEYRNEDGRKTVALSYYEVTNRFPEIEAAGILFTGPVDGMVNISFGEYRQAWMHFEAYIDTRNDIALDLLVGTLYRPEKKNYGEIKKLPDFDGQRSEPFNANLTQRYAALLADIPFWQKYAVLLWFLNCDRLIKQGELTVGGNPVSFAPLFRKDKETEEVETLDENELGLTQLLYMVAESNLFGNPEQVDRTAYIDILTALLYWKKQNDKIRKL